jgi:hypothetical protein
VCNDNSAARGPSQRFRYFAYGRKVQPSACRGLCISASGRNNSSRGYSATKRVGADPIGSSLYNLLDAFSLVSDAICGLV